MRRIEFITKYAIAIAEKETGQKAAQEAIQAWDALGIEDYIALRETHSKCSENISAIYHALNMIRSTLADINDARASWALKRADELMKQTKAIYDHLPSYSLLD